MRQAQAKIPNLRRGRAAEQLDWALHAKDTLVLGALAKGQHRDSLREYFGTTAYEELSALAASAKRVKRSGGPRVLIVPGMMGSRLCCTQTRRCAPHRGSEATMDRSALHRGRRAYGPPAALGQIDTRQWVCCSSPMRS